MRRALLSTGKRVSLKQAWSTVTACSDRLAGTPQEQIGLV